MTNNHGLISHYFFSFLYMKNTTDLFSILYAQCQLLNTWGVTNVSMMHKRQII